MIRLIRTYCRVGKQVHYCTELWLFGRRVHRWIGKPAFSCPSPF